MPAKPDPNKSRLAGSGTWLVTKSAPLLAVAITPFSAVLRYPTIYDPSERLWPVRFKVGEVPFVKGPTLAVKTKNPVAPGTNTWVDGRYAPIGFAGLVPAGYPRKSCSWPVLHDPRLLPVVAGLGDPPKIENPLGAEPPVSGTRRASVRLPERLPGLDVKPKSTGVPMLGLLVPLSPKQFEQNPCSASAEALPTPRPKTRNNPKSTTIRRLMLLSFAGFVIHIPAHAETLPMKSYHPIH
jgi:hypothetical protein